MDIPEVMYENKIDQMINDFRNNIQAQGLSIEAYCQYLGTSVDSLRSTFRDSAERSVKARLVLEAVAAAENISATKEEVDEQIGKIAESYGVSKEKALEIFKAEDRKNVEGDIIVQKAADMLADSAVEVEAEKK